MVYGSYTLSHGTNFSAGVAILFRPAANATVLSFTEVVKGQLLIVRAEIDALNQGPERAKK